MGSERFDAGRDDFRAAAVEAYARLCDDDLSAHVAPGVTEVLEALDARDGVRLAVLTGNLEPIAHLKLARAGLGGFFARGQGGFGSDHEDRTELPAIARARAGGYPREQTVIIGDTPRDIACAHADGSMHRGGHWPVHGRRAGGRRRRPRGRARTARGASDVVTSRRVRATKAEFVTR